MFPTIHMAGIPVDIGTVLLLGLLIACIYILVRDHKGYWDQ